MNITIPAIIYTFTSLFSYCLDRRKSVLLPVVLSCLLLCRGTKSFAALSRTVVTEERNRAALCKMYRRPRFRSRNIYEDAVYAVMENLRLGDYIENPVTWVLCIDGVCSRRGGFAKIENAIKYRKKGENRKGRSTKAHTFIQGLLITHTGVRIPLPRRSFYTKEYCKKHGKKPVKMTELAALIVEEVVIPPMVRVVVLADEFFEGTTLDTACGKRGFVYITPVDKRRCFENDEGKRLSGKLHGYGVSLNRKKLKKIFLKSTTERTALLRRRTGSDDNKRVYFATSEIQRVSGLGDVTVVYSWKPPLSARRWKKKWFKVLVSNATDMDTATLIEYYELRWQIEIFFRELKSMIGLTDFTGQEFSAYERFVDMVLLAYLFLEWYRQQKVSLKKSRNQKPSSQNVRTGVLLQLFQGEADLASISYIKECAGNNARLIDLCESVNRVLKFNH